MTSLDALVNQWRAEGLELLPPESKESIQLTFQKFGIQPTPDVINLYMLIGGMKMMDTNYWRLWSLQEIEKENIENPEFGLIFSDYLINCYCFRIKPIKYSDSEVYIDYFDGKNPKLVAKNLSSFFSLYLQNPDDVLIRSYE